MVEVPVLQDFVLSEIDDQVWKTLAFSALIFVVSSHYRLHASLLKLVKWVHMAWRLEDSRLFFMSLKFISNSHCFLSISSLQNLVFSNCQFLSKQFGSWISWHLSAFVPLSLCCVYILACLVLSVSIKSYILIVCRVLGELAVYIMQEVMASGVVMKRTLMWETKMASGVRMVESCWKSIFF
jgi:hypothetical protein